MEEEKKTEKRIDNGKQKERKRKRENERGGRDKLVEAYFGQLQSMRYYMTYNICLYEPLEEAKLRASVSSSWTARTVQTKATSWIDDFILLGVYWVLAWWWLFLADWDTNLYIAMVKTIIPPGWMLLSSIFHYCSRLSLNEFTFNCDAIIAWLRGTLTSNIK